MRLLLIACFIGFAAANLLQKAAPAIDESVLAFLEGAATAGSLSHKLGVNDPEIKQIADDIESELGRKIRDAVNDMLKKIEDNVDNGKAVGQELIEKVKELREKVRELGGNESEKIKEMVKNIREKAKEVLRKILGRLGLGKRNMDDSMDQVARMKFSDIIGKVRDKILSNENIKKIREYILNKQGESQILKKLREVVDKLSDVELKDIISDFFDFQHRSDIQRGETWEKVKKFFKDLNIKIQEHSKKFGTWVKDMWYKGMDKLREKHGTIKAIAMEFISNAKDLSAEMSREALEFFRPYKDDLGILWDRLVDVTKEVIGQF